MNETKLERSRRRWRIATAAVSVLSLWLLSNAGETITAERTRVAEQEEQVALLKQKLGETALEMREMGQLLAKSQQLIQLFGSGAHLAGGAPALPGQNAPRVVPVADLQPTPDP